MLLHVSGKNVMDCRHSNFVSAKKLTEVLDFVRNCIRGLEKLNYCASLC